MKSLRKMRPSPPAAVGNEATRDADAAKRKAKTPEAFMLSEWWFEG